MKKLSEVFKELGIDFSFPIEIEDDYGHETYYESSSGYWEKCSYNANGNKTYFEDSYGFKRGTPKEPKTCEGKVIELDGVKYELKKL